MTKLVNGKYGTKNADYLHFSKWAKHFKSFCFPYLWRRNTLYTKYEPINEFILRMLRKPVYYLLEYNYSNHWSYRFLHPNLTSLENLQMSKARDFQEFFRYFDTEESLHSQDIGHYDYIYNKWIFWWKIFRGIHFEKKLAVQKVIIKASVVASRINNDSVIKYHST